jgi:hypothetical protein
MQEAVQYQRLLELNIHLYKVCFHADIYFLPGQRTPIFAGRQRLTDRQQPVAAVAAAEEAAAIATQKTAGWLADEGGCYRLFSTT